MWKGKVQHNTFSWFTACDNFSKKEKSKWEEAAICCLRIEWSSVKALKALASIEGVIYCEQTRNVTSRCTHCNQQLISVTTCHSVFTVTVFLIAPQLTFNYSALLFYLIGIYQCLASSSSSPTIRFFPVFCQFLKKMEIESVLCEKVDEFQSIQKVTRMSKAISENCFSKQTKNFTIWSRANNEIKTRFCAAK